MMTDTTKMPMTATKPVPLNDVVMDVAMASAVSGNLIPMSAKTEKKKMSNLAQKFRFDALNAWIC